MPYISSLHLSHGFRCLYFHRILVVGVLPMVVGRDFVPILELLQH